MNLFLYGPCLSNMCMQIKAVRCRDHTISIHVGTAQLPSTND